VLSVAHARDMDVPGQLSVAGFDDTTLARMVWPPLTTIRQPTRDLAHAATTLLLNQAQGGGDAAQHPMQHQRLSHDLVIRGSTAAPLSHLHAKESPANDG
jgi:LacI family transcriptional regulator